MREIGGEAMDAMADFKEELEEMLLDVRSRARAEEISARIGGDADRFAIAWDIFCNGAPPLPQRMAWVLDVVTEQHPSHAARYAASIAARLPYMQHPAEQRAATKVLSRTAVPRDAAGHMLPILFAWLEDPAVTVAVRCNSMDILYNISNLEPELKRELAMVIGLVMEDGSAGLAARGRKVLARLQAELRAIAQAEADAAAKKGS